VAGRLAGNQESPRGSWFDSNVLRHFWKLDWRWRQAPLLTGASRASGLRFESSDFRSLKARRAIGTLAKSLAVDVRALTLLFNAYWDLDDEQLPSVYFKRDCKYPVSGRTGRDGVDDAAVAYWFPELV